MVEKIGNTYYIKLKRIGYKGPKPPYPPTKNKKSIRVRIVFDATIKCFFFLSNEFQIALKCVITKLIKPIIPTSLFFVEVSTRCQTSDLIKHPV